MTNISAAIELIEAEVDRLNGEIAYLQNLSNHHENDGYWIAKYYGLIRFRTFLKELHANLV